MGEQDSFAAERWVQIAADYGFGGVFHRDGCGDDAEALPVSRALVVRIATWQDAYTAHVNADFLWSPPWDDATFHAEGLAIARAVKAELPHFTVLYYQDEVFLPGV